MTTAKLLRMRESSLRSYLLAVCCGILGYIIGSVPSSTKYNLEGQVDIKSSSQPIENETDTLMREIDVVSGLNNSIDESFVHLPTNKSLIEEIMPPKLQPVYEILQFNVTRSMLRQSRPVIGNTQRLHHYLKKLRNKECTTVLFMGGSVTAGHNAGGPQFAYPTLFIDWLNEVYPCVSANGTVGKHERIPSAPGIKNSQTAFLYFSSIRSIEKLDLVFTEFNVNDAFLAGYPPHALKNETHDNHATECEVERPIESDGYYASAFYFEVLLRRLLLLRKPDPIAIVTFNADYTGRPWNTALGIDRMSLFRKNMEPTKLWISSMYEIPVFSAVSWMLPLAGKKGSELQFSKTYEFGTKSWHADQCCHPKKYGHRILSLVIAFCLLEEERVLSSHQYSNRADIERDFTADPIPFMREPLYLNPEEDIAYVSSIDVEEGMIDFTNPDEKKEWEGKVAVNEGWMWYADNKFNDKYGLITNNSAGKSHVAISLTGGKNGLVEVSYVVSYETFGRGLAWLDDSLDNTKQDLCKKVLYPCKTNKGDDTKWRIHKSLTCRRYVEGIDMILNGIWSNNASTQLVTLLRKKIPLGEHKYLHICLTPRDASSPGTDNKFKLLSVRTF